MVDILTDSQRLLLSKIAADPWFSNQFYFTGGTALSAFYLQHRYSEDLDFFSEKRFDQLTVETSLATWGKDLNFTFESFTFGDTQVFQLRFVSNEILKVDVTYFPFRRLSLGEKIDGVVVDSLVDIATNKLMTINQRTEIKDFVDLYFLLQKFTIWDLFAGVETKYRQKFDLLITSSDLMKVEKFDYLPKMILPLDLKTLKNFYRDLAKKIGSTAVTE